MKRHLVLNERVKNNVFFFSYSSLLRQTSSVCLMRSCNSGKSWGSAEMPWARTFLLITMGALDVLNAWPNGNTLWILLLTISHQLLKQTFKTKFELCLYLSNWELSSLILSSLSCNWFSIFFNVTSLWWRRCSSSAILSSIFVASVCLGSAEAQVAIFTFKERDKNIQKKVKRKFVQKKETVAHTNTDGFNQPAARSAYK